MTCSENGNRCNFRKLTPKKKSDESKIEEQLEEDLGRCSHE